jgi:hypothetical protein
MIEKFEYKGVWWLPDNPEKPISGTLMFVPGEGAVLNLMGSFNGSFEEIKSTNSEGSITKRVWTGKLFEPEIMLGTSSCGKKITLHKCFETNERYSSSGFPTSSFYANIVFIGWHFTKPEELKFKSFFVNYPYFEEWSKIRVFSHCLESEEKSKQYEVKYEVPEPVEAKIDNFKISFDHNLNISGDRLREVNLKHTTFVKIEPEDELHFEEYQSILYHLQNFLSLATTRAIYPLSIKATTEQYKHVSTFSKGKVHHPPIEIFYNVIGEVDLSEKLNHYDMLFTFEDISGQFETYLQNWFDKAELLKPVYDLFFGTLYKPSMYLEVQFLSLIQAVESYHRRRFGGKYLSDEDYKEVCDTLVNAIPDSVEGGFKDSLESRIRYGNEFSLRTRLRRLFDSDEYQEILSEFAENKNAFIGKVVDTRNYLTHYEGKEKAAIGEELDPFIQKLKILLEICLLTELGFGSEEVKKLFSRNKRYQRESIQ